MNNYTNSNMQGFQLTPEDTFLPNYTDSDSPPWFISAKNNERRIISLRCVSKLLSKSRSPVVFIPLHVFPLFWNLTSKNSSHYYCKLPFSYEVCISIYIDYPRKRPWFHGSKKKISNHYVNNVEWQQNKFNTYMNQISKIILKIWPEIVHFSYKF